MQGAVTQQLHHQIAAQLSLLARLARLARLAGAPEESRP